MTKRDIKKVVTMSQEGLSKELCLRIIINLSVPHLSVDDVAHIADSIIKYNELRLASMLKEQE